MYLTVLCQSYILESPFSLSKAFFLLRRTTIGGILGREKTQMKGERDQRQHSERMSSLFNENNQYPHYLFKVMHLLGNVILFLC